MAFPSSAFGIAPGAPRNKPAESTDYQYLCATIKEQWPSPAIWTHFRELAAICWSARWPTPAPTRTPSSTPSPRSTSGATVSFEKVKRGGIGATKYHVACEEQQGAPPPLPHRQDDRARRRSPSRAKTQRASRSSASSARPRPRSTRSRSRRSTFTKSARSIPSPISSAPASRSISSDVETRRLLAAQRRQRHGEDRARHSSGARARHGAAARRSAGLCARTGDGTDHADRRGRRRHARHAASA